MSIKTVETDNSSIFNFINKPSSSSDVNTYDMFNNYNNTQNNIQDKHKNIYDFIFEYDTQLLEAKNTYIERLNHILNNIDTFFKSKKYDTSYLSILERIIVAYKIEYKEFIEEKINIYFCANSSNNYYICHSNDNNDNSIDLGQIIKYALEEIESIEKKIYKQINTKITSFTKNQISLFGNMDNRTFHALLKKYKNRTFNEAPPKNGGKLYGNVNKTKKYKSCKNRKQNNKFIIINNKTKRTKCRNNRKHT